MKKCSNCGSETTYINKKYNTERWYNNKDKNGLLCMKCYQKLINNPRMTPEYLKKYNDRRNPEAMRKYSREYDKRIGPIIKKKINAIYHARLLRFKDKTVSLKENPRIGFCNICKKSIGDEYINKYGQTAKIKLTHMHHMNYHDDNPLKDSMEVCASCHANKSHKEIQIIVI